jgi:hypothetical protein
MDNNLQKKLYDRYPDLFSNKEKSYTESCMAWGIDCGDGWYHILDSLCGLIIRHEQQINPDQYYPVRFDQVKEKYGGLRVYFSGGDEYISGLIDMAEATSYKTCEVCGDAGKSNEQGWISTLCDSHRKLLKERTA